ncbi:MAG: hypothetical protein M3P01_11490 [Actinomycetota bacterium]|nr:hypothetical protein [Actinomycetota bacterium]
MTLQLVDDDKKPPEVIDLWRFPNVAEAQKVIKVCREAKERDEYQGRPPPSPPPTP